MTLQEFEFLTHKLEGKVKFLYFHLMGEPFLHPLLPDFIQIAYRKNFIPILTTNGTLLSKQSAILGSLPHKIQISLHSHEANGENRLEPYLDQVMTFAKESAQRGCIIVLRLWNQGGFDQLNESILTRIASHCPPPWTPRRDGWKLSNNLFIEYDHHFEWPNLQHESYNEPKVFCYALRNQIGVLADGTVVPCCLDHNGKLSLGNLFKDKLEDILSSPRAQAIYNGFSAHTAIEPLCQRCGYSSVTKQYRKKTTI